MDMTRKTIDEALKTNAEITAKLIRYAKAQEQMIKDLFQTIEIILDKMYEDEEDDSA